MPMPELFDVALYLHALDQESGCASSKMFPSDRFSHPADQVRELTCFDVVRALLFVYGT